MIDLIFKSNIQILDDKKIRRALNVFLSGPRRSLKDGIQACLFAAGRRRRRRQRSVDGE